MTSPTVSNVRAAIQEAARRSDLVRAAAIAEAERIKADHDATAQAPDTSTQEG